MGDKPREFDLERTQKLERACEEWRVVASHDRQGRPTSRPVAAGPPLTRRADTYDVGNYRVPAPDVERAARELGWTPEECGAAEWLVARVRRLLLEAYGARQSDGTDADSRLTDERHEAEAAELRAEVARLTAEVDRLTALYAESCGSEEMLAGCVVRHSDRVRELEAEVGRIEAERDQARSDAYYQAEWDLCDAFGEERGTAQRDEVGGRRPVWDSLVGRVRETVTERDRFAACLDDARATLAEHADDCEQHRAYLARPGRVGACSFCALLGRIGVVEVSDG